MFVWTPNFWSTEAQSTRSLARPSWKSIITDSTVSSVHTRVGRRGPIPHSRESVTAPVPQLCCVQLGVGINNQTVSKFQHTSSRTVEPICCLSIIPTRGCASMINLKIIQNIQLFTTVFCFKGNFRSMSFHAAYTCQPVKVRTCLTRPHCLASR